MSFLLVLEQVLNGLQFGLMLFLPNGLLSIRSEFTRHRLRAGQQAGE